MDNNKMYYEYELINELTKNVLDNQAKEFSYLLSNINLGKRVLDVGCGYGRFLKILPENCMKVGIDYVISLLKQAENNCISVRNIEFFNTDIFNFKYPMKFDTILLMGTTFGAYNTDEKNEYFLQEVVKHLNNNGKLIIDVVNKEKAVKDNITVVTEKLNDKIVRVKYFDLITSRIKVSLINICKEDNNIINYSYRWYGVNELLLLLNKHNLVFTNIYGDYTCRELQDENCNPQRTIIIAERRDI